jgi:hypothetical protein
MSNRQLDRQRRRRIVAWRVCLCAVGCLSAITFSPLVLSPDVIEPAVFGLPRTLWVGLLIAAAFLIITIVGAAVHPGREDTDTQQ